MARRRDAPFRSALSFADRLKEVRRARNLTQAGPAQRAQVPASYISDLDKAKTAPGPDLVDRPAKALETIKAELLPSESTLEAPDGLREQAAQLCADLVQEADKDVLAIMNSYVALLGE